MIRDLLFIPVGIIVGMLSGFYGIGGGIVLVPVLFLSGFSPAVAVPTSLMFSFGTSLSGAIAHTRMKNVDWKIAVMIGVVGALSAQASKYIVIFISGRYDWVLRLFFIILQCYFFRSLHKNKDNPQENREPKNPYIAAPAIGLIIGFLSSLLGIGGGFITVPLLISWLGFNSRRAVGTSLAAIIIVSLGGITGYSTQEALNYLLGLCLIIGAFIGSPVGARMTARYQTTEMTQNLSILFLFVIASLTVDLVALLFALPLLKWLSLAILLAFLAYMLVDMYRHRKVSLENTKD
jgi:uncharacterized membrane protein YfcA